MQQRLVLRWPIRHGNVLKGGAHLLTSGSQFQQLADHSAEVDSAGPLRFHKSKNLRPSLFESVRDVRKAHGGIWKLRFDGWAVELNLRGRSQKPSF